MFNLFKSKKKILAEKQIEKIEDNEMYASFFVDYYNYLITTTEDEEVIKNLEIKAQQAADETKSQFNSNFIQFLKKNY